MQSEVVLASVKVHFKILGLHISFNLSWLPRALTEMVRLSSKTLAGLDRYEYIMLLIYRSFCP